MSYTNHSARAWRAGMLVVMSLLIAPAAFAQQQQRIHHTLLEQPSRPWPKKLVAVPADVVVREVSAGGVLERVPHWTEQASANLTRAMDAIASGREGVAVVPLPPLSEAERDLLDNYLATYFVVVGTANQVTLQNDPAWEHKRKRFDYTLGGGLTFLKEKTGADAAVFIVGDDIVSSSERKAAAIIGLFFGVGIPLGRSVVAAGVVDLETGDLLWTHHTVSMQYDLKDYDSAHKMLHEIFAGYPGGSEKRK